MNDSKDTKQTNSDQLQPKITRYPFTLSSRSHKPQMASGPTVFLILDGWGIGPDYPGNAIKLAKTPNMDRLWISYPHTQLGASGESVGLPKGVDGNSETGHMNIGAGSLIFQDLPRINAAIADGSFATNQAILNTFAHVKKNHAALHLMGLVSSGFVHSSIEHLYALLRLAKEHDLSKVYVHAFTDGRDSPPTAGASYVRRLMDQMQKIGVGEIASVMGRFYAMDRDKKWDRIEKAYNALTIANNRCAADPIKVIEAEYAQDVTDEYITPTNICDHQGQPRTINDGDGVIFFNFRVDRPRELTRAFVMPNFEAGYAGEDYDPYYEKYHKTSIQQAEFVKTFKRQKVLRNLYFTTMTTYEKNLPVDVIFPKLKIRENIGHVLSQYGLRQLRLTETEKERMVTYYMNGQNEDGNPGEDWVIFPSKGARSYAEVPEMDANEISDYLVNQLEHDIYDVTICNICNGDMVGHTGDLQAGIKACGIVDQAVGKIEKAVLAKGGRLLISADHGNVEEMIDMKTGEPDTKHSTFPVPFIIVDKRYQGKNRMLPTGILADIMPTMLHLMGLPKPEMMTGHNLFILD